jgi:rod shape-determining protein MreD
MIRWSLLATAIYAALVVQTTLGASLSGDGIAPDFVVLATTIWLFAGRGRFDFLGAWGAGIAVDLAAPGSVGLGGATMAVWGYLAAKSVRRGGRGFLAIALAAAVGAIMVGCATGALGRLRGDVHLGWSSLVVRVALVGAYTACGALVWQMCRLVVRPETAEKAEDFAA